MKNYVKEGQKLPLFGIGPYLITGIALVELIGIILFGYVLKIGSLDGVWVWIFRILGIILIISGIIVWYIGAVRSNMDKSITENKLQTEGIYKVVRNPMYSGWWMLISGICLMWHNYMLLSVILINWGIITIVLINTEEKWLLNLYGQEYLDYKKRVNRCIPWFPRK
ncbi:MAG: isoprenylcysteine carboxylmethyltransferase family protein [Clostridiales bacterium]|nr:isoprenylcysteine carboxylmethyltransferase family protein [Clostridiales bacterium]